MPLRRVYSHRSFELRWFAVLALVFSCSCSTPNASPEETCRENGDCDRGVECDADDQCGSSLCTGICAQPCQDEQQCPDGEGCRLAQVGEEFKALCAAAIAAPGDLGDPCSADEDCRGAICDAGLCTELCSSCTTGAICVPQAVRGVDVGLCKWAPVAPLVSSGPHAVGLDGSSEITFTIPTGLESFTLIVRDTVPGGTRRVGVASLVGPDGEVLENGDLDTSDANPAAIRYPDAATILMPVRDTGAPPEPGNYSLTARIWDIDFEAADPFVPTTGEVIVDVVYEWGGERGGLLDLNLFASPATGLGPGPQQPFLDPALDVVRAQFAAAGVALGEVTVSSLPAAYDVVDSSNLVRDICREFSAPGRYGAAVNVFLVDRLDFALGFTGGSPSPPGAFGLASSGVVIDVGSDPEETGVVLAHELGHFLGLSHTTAFNQDGSVFGTDPIADTPECADEGSQCSDRANLMFPTIDFGQDHTLSPGQLDVLSRNPALYEFVRPDLCSVAPARDITVTRRASGFLAASGQTSGSCGGRGGEAVHALRVREPTTLQFSGGGAGTVMYLRQSSCADGAELACSTDGGLSVEVQPGEYFLFVDGEEGGAYHLSAD